MRLLPDLDIPKIAAFVLLVVPTTAAVNYATQSELLKAGLCIAGEAALYAMVFGVQVVANRAGYYRWYVVATTPLLACSIVLLILSAYGLSRYFDSGNTLGITLGTKTFAASEGGHVLLCVGGLMLSMYLLRRAYRRLRLLSLQQPLPAASAILTISYVGRTQVGHAAASWPSDDTGKNEAFSATVQLADFIDSLAVSFAALERVGRAARASALVWSGTKLALLRPLAILSSDTSGQMVQVNTLGRLDRLSLRDGSELRFEVKASPGEAWFEEGAQFRKCYT